MRRILYVLLLVIVLASGFGVPAKALGSAVSLGFVPGQGLVRDGADARQLADLLAARLATPVQVRLLDSETELHQWLSRYRELDYGWLGESYLGQLPAGELLILVGAESRAGVPLSGRFVARQGVDARLLQQVRDALMAFGDRPEEAAFLEGLELSGFVASRDLPAAARPLVPPAAAAASTVPAAVVPTAGPVAARPAPTAATPPTPPTQAPTDPAIVLTADRLDYDGVNDLVRAGGSVSLQRGEVTLSADELLWQQTTRDAAASGAVHLTEPSAELSSGSLSANLATGLGVARDGRVFLRERNFHLAGAEIERLGEATYRVSDGRFTTCDGEVPDWQFTADQVDVTLGNYAAARNVWFEIRNQPLLYLPYLIFPVKAERESGFLLPRAGYSSRKGGMLSLAWYEVIDRHLDATVYVDALSRLGIGKGLEYRYALGGGNLGEALYYHVTGLKGNDDTFALKWRHAGVLPGEISLTADVDYVEDIEFFEDFGEAASEYSRDHTVSTIMLRRNWQALSLTLLAEFIKDLEGDDDTTLQRLPELSLNLPLRRLGTSPFFLQAETRLTNFVRKEGVDGLRLYVHPELSAPLNPGRWLELTPRVALHGRYYEVDDTDAAIASSDDDDESLVAEYAMDASSRFSRVFAFPYWGFEKLKHSIEPRVTYTYIPEGSQAALPYFDAIDRIGPANRIEYALVNRLTARAVDADGNRTYRELLNLRLSQSYDIAVARDDDRHDPEDFSELRVELQASPTASSFVNLDAVLPVYGDGRLSRVTASAGYAGRSGNTASLDYSYVRAEAGAVPNDYLGVNLGTGVLAPVYLSFQERYDFHEGQSLESLLNIEYRQKCWSLFVTLRNRPALDDGPDDNEIMVGFALSGIGRIGGFGGAPAAPTVQ